MRMLQPPKNTPQSPPPQKKRGDPARIAPFWKLADLAMSWLTAWLRVRVYVAYTTTTLVWISSASSMPGLFQPQQLCVTRFGAMLSPSRSLLTPRVSFWTHWRSFDRDVPHAAVVALDSRCSSYRRPA